jgi:hypothetical protein
MVRAKTKPSPAEIRIDVGKQADGCAYELHPSSKAFLARTHGEVRPAPTLFVGYETRDDFEAVHGPMWKQIAMILTGLPWSQLKKLGVEFFDPAEGKRITTLAA